MKEKQIYWMYVVLWGNPFERGHVECMNIYIIWRTTGSRALGTGAKRSKTSSFIKWILFIESDRFNMTHPARHTPLLGARLLLVCHIYVASPEKRNESFHIFMILSIRINMCDRCIATLYIFTSTNLKYSCGKLYTYNVTSPEKTQTFYKFIV